MLNCSAPEGNYVEIPYKGPVASTIVNMLGCLQSTCSYVGAEKLRQLHRKCTFVKVSQQHSRVFASYEKKDLTGA